MVRGWLMRSTIHLVSAPDCLALRPALQPVLEQPAVRERLRGHLAGVDLEALLAAGPALLGPTAAHASRARALLAERLARPRPPSLATPATFLLALVQVPPRGTLWTRPARAAAHHRRGLAGPRARARRRAREVSLRYLAAFGPATVADIQRGRA